MSWSNRNLGLRLLAESSHPYPRLHSLAAPRLSNLAMYFLLGAYTKRRASEVLTKTEPLSRTVSLSWQPDKCGLSPGQVLEYALFVVTAFMRLRAQKAR